MAIVAARTAPDALKFCPTAVSSAACCVALGAGAIAPGAAAGAPVGNGPEKVLGSGPVGETGGATVVLTPRLPWVTATDRQVTADCQPFQAFRCYYAQVSPLTIGAFVAAVSASSALIPLVWALRLERQLRLARQLTRAANEQCKAAEHDVVRWRELFLVERRAHPPDKRVTTLWRG